MNKAHIRSQLVFHPSAVLLVALLAAALATSCSAPAATPTPVPTPEPTPQPGSVQVNSSVPGWTVYLDGTNVGTTPLTLQLAPGTYSVEVRGQDQSVKQETVTVRSGDQLMVLARGPDTSAPTVTLDPLPGSVIAGQTLRVVARAQDDERVRWIRLLVDDKVMAEINSPLLEYQWDTLISGSGGHEVRVEAEDAAGNLGQATTVVVVQPLPTVVPTTTPTPQATRTPAVMAVVATDLQARESVVTLLTYPYEAFLRSSMDPQSRVTLWSFDRAGYEASQPQPQPKTFKTVILENRYLRLVFLPELGGRLYQCTLKNTGLELFYQNPVVKPSFWGPLDRNQNWWLAVGGMEWALPVQEHGYLWGRPWSYHVETQETRSIITLTSPADQSSVRAEIQVILPAESAYFVVRPRLLNRSSQPVSLQFWLNAMLTLGSFSASPSTEFIYPTDQMIVHSTGDSDLPGERQPLSWPVYNGRNLAQYGNWRSWLGVFVPELSEGYVGAYNHEADLGIARVFPQATARGAKLFAFGTGFASLDEYTSDQSDYFELWGGPCRTFWPEDNITLAAGQELLWSEVWLPFRGIDGLDRAAADIAVKTVFQRGQVRLGITSGTARLVHVTLLWNGESINEQTLSLTPGSPALLTVPLSSSLAPPATITVRVQDPQGATLLEYVKKVSS